MSVSCNIISQQKVEVLNPALGAVYRWSGGTGILYRDALQNVTFALRGNVNEMPVYFDVPFNYIIGDSRTKIPDTENVWIIIMLTELEYSTTVTMRESKLKTMSEVQLSV
jgi:hypothetical protein